MTDIKNEEAGEKKSLNFIEQAVEKDLKEGKNGGKCRRYWLLFFRWSFILESRKTE